MQKISLAQKLRYKFDNTMSKGPIALILWLAFVSLLVVLVATSLVVVFKIFPEGTEEDISFFEAFWQSLMRSMDAGTVAGDAGWEFRALMLAVTLGGIFIVSTLVGILSNGIQEKLEDLRKGRSLVVENNHTLILGWSPKVFTIISELVIANENQKKPCIVILSLEDKTVMEDEVRDKIADLKNTRVICRHANPNDMTDLMIGNPHNAKSILILGTEDEDSDAHTIKTILALTNHPERKKEAYHIIAEMLDEKNLEVAKIVGKDEVELLLTDDLISRMMVQTCRQSGLSVVYTELMDFDGAEIYFKEEQALVGKTFGESLALYKDSAVIGMQFPDGSVKVNPLMETVYEKGAKVIAITEDDDTLILGNSGEISIAEDAISAVETEEGRAESTIVLGWNKRGEAIIREMDNYVKKGSVIHVVSQYEEDREVVENWQTLVQNITVKFSLGATTDRKIIDGLQVETYNHIIVLSYIDRMDVQAADSRTLITLLHLRHIQELLHVDLSIVSEMMDMRNRELAAVTKADDFVVSDKMISLLMSQVSENKHLMRVFEDIFDAEGSEIYLKPVANYIKPGVPVNFYTILESARRKGEIAIGYRKVADSFDPGKAYGVKVNPLKSDTVSFSEEDRIIVFAED